MNQIQIGKFIAECRKKVGLTQNQLAEQLGITNKAVSKWENGRSMPDVSLFTELCKILNVTLNELIAGEYITENEIKEKSEEVLMGVFLHKKKSMTYMVTMQTISSILMGVGTAILFIPSFKNFEQTASIIIIFIGLILLHLGMIGKIRYYR